MTVIALVGRPNVGKSSIFNRLAGKQLAIVHDTPGVTRDYRIADAELGPHKFQIMDTAGLEQFADSSDSMLQHMQDKTLLAVSKADVLLFVLNGQEGVTPVDESMARYIRQWNKPVLLLINKADDKRSKQTALEAFGLGLGEPIPISAAHNQGFIDLEDMLTPLLPEIEAFVEVDEYDMPEFTEEISEEEAAIIEEDPTKPIKIAIVGRPNVGKSTLLNSIIGEDRAITSPIAGTTRDPVMVQWVYNDRPFRLVDTAGLRKKAKIIDHIEKMSATESLRAIRLAQVVILVLDVSEALDHQDLSIAELCIKEGRALVIAVNKWDTATDKEALREELRYLLDKSVSQVKDVPMVTISALTGKNVNKLLDKVVETYRIWQKRVATSPLNKWLEQMESGHPPPMASGRSNRLRYMTQIKSKPPTFAVWCSRPDDMPDSYERYLVNGLRERFDIPGVPIRLYFRSSKNPYIGEKKRNN